MKRVIIVDDAIELGRMLQDTLRVAHPEIPVTVVPSAEEALLESTRFAFDLLVADLRLPGMSGVELIRKIRVHQPNIRVILITALLPEDPLFRQKEEITPDIFMRKPITVSEFLDAAEQLLRLPAPVNRSSAGASSRPEPTGSEPVDDLLNELATVMPGEPAEPDPRSVKKGAGGNDILEEGGLSGILSKLRGQVGALSVILLDERGHPVAQAGALSAIAVEDELASPVISSLSAGMKISYLLGQSMNNSVQAYRGIDIDLVLAPVGQYALIVALKASRTALRLALAFEETLIAQGQLVDAMEEMGLRLQTVIEVHTADEKLAQLSGDSAVLDDPLPPEALAVPPGQDLIKFEALFTQETTGQLDIEDPDSFWETASPGEDSNIARPGVLSFEQAQKLGLFPPDTEEQT